jgi:DNA-binding NtrC family response regulator
MRAEPHVLVADDERSIRLMLETGLALNGFRVTAVRNGREAIEAAASNRFDAVLSDVYMPDGSGLDVVDTLRAGSPELPIVLITARATLEAAVEAMARGATDFIGKPFEIASVVALIRRYLGPRQASLAAPSDANAPSRLVGRSGPMVQVFKLIAQAARSDAPVLIGGESGTGKELVARAIHDFGPRKTRPFLPVNCAGLTDTLLEAELFGAVRGAFTGATADRQGLFEAADGGTLFLDELASTTPAFQASLLRVLQSGEVRRVGSTQTHHVNVRIIGATNASLTKLVQSGAFRTDLYYRLGVLTVDLPPLRERPGDIELLTAHFLRLFRAATESELQLSREALQALAAYDYPGNVRELENALRRAVGLSANGLITLDCLPPEFASRGQSISTTEPAARSLVTDRPSMDELQRRYLHLVLRETEWNRRRAAAILQLDRRTIQRLIARYQLGGLSDPEASGEDDC